MNATKTMRRLSVLLAALALGCTSAAGCGGSKEYEVRGSERLPGADAEMVVTPMDSGNFKVTVDVENLAPPERLGAGLSHYVVWVNEPNQEPRRLGYLPLDGDREAEMYGTTVATGFEVMVTAEHDADALFPSEHVVLRQTVRMDS
jgi:hypothetical protein